MSLLLNKILDCLQDRQLFNPQAIGLNMSLPLNNSPINSENTKFVEFLLPGSRYSDPVLFLPYVPGCINACVFNGRQDIVSAPFSAAFSPFAKARKRIETLFSQLNDQFLVSETMQRIPAVCLPKLLAKSVR